MVIYSPRTAIETFHFLFLDQLGKLVDKQLTILKGGCNLRFFFKSIRYVSLQSALYYHGMISQIPAVLYAVSLGRTRYYRTPLVDVSIHHIDLGLFRGYIVDEESGIGMATPEKALLDVFYLSDTQTKLFASLPEIELPPRFSKSRAFSLIKTIRALKKQTLVLRRFEKLLTFH